MMEGSDPAAILREIQSLARSGHVPVRFVTPRQIQQAQGSEAPQGVIAFAEPLAEVDLSDLVGLTGDGSRPSVATGRHRGPAGSPTRLTRTRRPPWRMLRRRLRSWPGGVRRER